MHDGLSLRSFQPFAFSRRMMTPMGKRVRSSMFTVLLASAQLLQPVNKAAEPIAVRHVEGVVRGFLVLSTL